MANLFQTFLFCCLVVRLDAFRQRLALCQSTVALVRGGSLVSDPISSTHSTIDNDDTATTRTTDKQATTRTTDKQEAPSDDLKPRNDTTIDVDRVDRVVDSVQSTSEDDDEDEDQDQEAVDLRTVVEEQLLVDDPTIDEDSSANVDRMEYADAYDEEEEDDADSFVSALQDEVDEDDDTLAEPFDDDDDDLDAEEEEEENEDGEAEEEGDGGEDTNERQSEESDDNDNDNSGDGDDDAGDDSEEKDDDSSAERSTPTTSETTPTIQLESEITDEMEAVMLNELKYRPADLKVIRPEIASIVAAKKIHRPIEGLPASWYREGSVIPSGKRYKMIRRVAISLVACALAVGLGSQVDLSVVSDRLPGSSKPVAPKPPAPSPPEDPYKNAFAVLEEPDPRKEEEASGQEAAAEEEEEHSHAIRPGSKAPPREPLDETWLDKGITAIGRAISSIFRKLTGR